MQLYITNIYARAPWFDKGASQTLGVKSYPSAANFLLVDFGERGSADSARN